MAAKREVNAERREALLARLEARFDAHMERHAGVRWADVRARLEAHPEALRSLDRMESTGGEPDVVGCDQATGAVRFVDCSKQSPSGRRSICYDRAAREARKKFPPKADAVSMAAEMGIELLDEEAYRALQRLGAFDTTTSSWIATPSAVRDLGGALFCDRRYDTVFVYHNGADSYYGARGFRGSLWA